MANFAKVKLFTFYKITLVYLIFDQLNVISNMH